MRRTRTLVSPLSGSEVVRRLAEAGLVVTREEADLYEVGSSPALEPRAGMRLVTTRLGTEVRLHVRQQPTGISDGLLVIGCAVPGVLVWLVLGSVLVACLAAYVGLVIAIALSPGRPAYSVLVPVSEESEVEQLLARIEAAIGATPALEPYRSPATGAASDRRTSLVKVRRRRV